MNERWKLYVEGKDDLAVICQLATIRDVGCRLDEKGVVRPKFRVEEYDTDGKAIRGIDSLLRMLPVRLKLDDYDRLGVVVDADDDVATRWEGLRAIFLRAGYASTPLQPDPDGTIIEEPELPRIGVWIWPDNVSTGMLEDFAATMIRSDDSLIGKARQTVDEVIRIDRRFPEGYGQKAVIHTWLAWQSRPGRPQGMAILVRDFDPDSSVATHFLAWLSRLFGE